MRITAEWALWGMRPGSKGSNGVLSCSRGRIGRADFGELVDRYARANPGEQLPQVTIARAGADQNAHIVLAVQEWSGEFDGMGRGIAVTRCFCVPYVQAASGALSYEQLYTALVHHALPLDGDPLVVSTPSPEIVRAVNPTAMGTAALLLTGRRVCVVQADGVPLLDRLRFLDTVAALLPYGFRAKLVASTWAPAAAEHRSRLFFAGHPSAEAHNVSWGQEVSVPEGHEVAHRYHDMLKSKVGKGLTELLARLALDTRQRRFSAEDLSAVLPAAESGAPPSPLSIDDVLMACADSIEHGKADLVPGHLARLDALRESAPPNGGLTRRRNIISDRRLLMPSPALVPAVQDRLYDLVLSLGYGPQLTADGLGRILGDVDPIPSRLLSALCRMPTTDPAVTLRLAHRLNESQSVLALASLSVKELVDTGERERKDASIVRLVCSELAARWDEPAQRAAIGAVLRGRTRFMAAVERLDGEEPDSQVGVYLVLLIADYGPSLGPDLLREAFFSHADVLSVPLLTALALLCDPPAYRLLTDFSFREFLNQGGITSKTFEKFQIEHDTPEPVTPWTRVSPQGKRDTDVPFLRRLGFTYRKRA
ncbi:hypothetical protein [Streptosporangium sp. NPDC002524]|uniref:hypothetical protein n=1 Tax=Streptosporangium sp. NPDC002524 TaxID=3154537 RepID=UPI00333366AF